MKRTIIILLALAISTKADLLGTIGTGLANGWIGACRGLSDDYTQTQTVCVSSCKASSVYIVNMFDLTTYTNQ